MWLRGFDVKFREKQILRYIVENDGVPLKRLLEKFGVSRRTLYYDIEAINEALRGIGRVKNDRRVLVYEGKPECLAELGATAFYEDAEGRKDYILYQILLGNLPTIDEAAARMDISKNTVIQTIDKIKSELSAKAIQLVYRKGYTLVGDEYVIRDIFLRVMENDSRLGYISDKDVIQFDNNYGIKLTDHARGSLSMFKRFVAGRVERGFVLTGFVYADEVGAFPYYEGVRGLLPDCANEYERLYLCAYIASLSSLNGYADLSFLDGYVKTLINRFEAKTAIYLSREEDFIKNIKRHLQSSYYRIKFGFPVGNAVLNDVKSKHEYLFYIVKGIIRNTAEYPDFTAMRDEEIAFITAYFGGYMMHSDDGRNMINKVLLVCPNGLMVSRSLEVQLYRYIPNIDIVDTISLKEFWHYKGTYDFVITTIAIPEVENALVISPILTKADIAFLLSKLKPLDRARFDLEMIMRVIRENTKIKDEKRLYQELFKAIYGLNEKGGHEPMLHELLTSERIRKVKSVEDWQSAIAEAAKPLLEDGSITQVYIDAMIDSILTHGPYIVLADYFALPHASAKSGVNRLSMALLQVEETVDLLGSPVNVFLVLAAVDNTSHLKALAALSELLYEEKNLDVFRRGDREQILKLINEEVKE